MKTGILLVFLLLSGVSVFAQGSLELKVYFGVAGALAGPKQQLTGSSSVEMEGFKEFGLSLSKNVGGKFRLNGGLAILDSSVEYFPNFSSCFNCLSIVYEHNPNFRMLSLPLYAEYELTKFLFVAAGPVVDFQLSEGNNFDDQSGVGYLVGLGGKVRAEKFTFSLFPNYKRHGVIPFERNGNAKDILQELGVQFGVGYRF